MRRKLLFLQTHSPCPLIISSLLNPLHTTVFKSPFSSSSSSSSSSSLKLIYCHCSIKLRAARGWLLSPLNCTYKGAQANRQAGACKPVKLFGIVDSYSSFCGSSGGGMKGSFLTRFSHFIHSASIPSDHCFTLCGVCENSLFL